MHESNFKIKTFRFYIPPFNPISASISNHLKFLAGIRRKFSASVLSPTVSGIHKLIPIPASVLF